MSEVDQGKRVFLVATESPNINDFLEARIRHVVPAGTIFKAYDGLEAQFKCENVPPQIVILDSRLPKMNALDLTEKLIRRKERTAVIILSPTEEHELFMDQLVTGQVQFLSGADLENVFTSHLHRALNWVNQESNSLYHIRYLGPHERLLTEGEPGDYVYLVKSGELKAYKMNGDSEVVLGQIKPGEFVGEMAYINGEARSANVISVTECELIEFRSETLDAVLFSKPAWSKALMKTLSRRLKISNEVKSESSS